MDSARDFQSEILELRKNVGPGYGDNVIPAIELFETLESNADRRAYQDAVESLLTSDDPDVRGHAVTLCLGFVVFRGTR